MSEKKTDSNEGGMIRKTIKLLIISLLLYEILNFIILVFPPTYKIYLEYKYDTAPIYPKQSSKPTPAKEIHNVHTYKDMLKHAGQEVLIFRNFSNCATKFDETLYPRRKTQRDHFQRIEFSPVGPGNVFSTGFISRNKTMVEYSLQDIIEMKDPNLWASFLKIFGQEDYRLMLNAEASDNFIFDSSFVSHFAHPVVSTVLHSASFVQTFSTQCYGTKAWLFYHSSDINKHGFFDNYSPQGQVINGDPDSFSQIPSVRAIVHANDVLYFPPNYFHAVASSAGKNIMFAIRKLDKESFKLALHNIRPRKAILCITRFFVMQIWNRRNKKIGYSKNNFYMPFRDEGDEINLKRAEVFQSINGLNLFFGNDESDRLKK